MFEKLFHKKSRSTPVSPTYEKCEKEKFDEFIRSRSLPKVRFRRRSQQEEIEEIPKQEIETLSASAVPKRFRRKSDYNVYDNKKKEHERSKSLPKKREPTRSGSICETRLDQSLYYKWLSANPSITMEDVLSNLDKEWDHKFLSKNPNISMEDAMNHPEFDWDFEVLRRKE